MNTDEILKLYIDDFNSKINNPTLISNIVPNSFPIVWFGNIDNYLKSDLKIITIGLNPSNIEFERNDDGLARFTHNLNSSNYAIPNNSAIRRELKRNLDEYFKYNPYKRWFNNPEYSLNLLNSSYYDNNKKYQSIHIDINSAIATNPTWSKLSKEIQKQLICSELVEVLLDYLSPQIILFSGAASYISNLLISYEMILTVNPNSYSESFNKMVSIDMYKNENDKIIIRESPLVTSAFGLSKEFKKIAYNKFMNYLK